MVSERRFDFWAVILDSDHRAYALGFYDKVIPMKVIKVTEYGSEEEAKLAACIIDTSTNVLAKLDLSLGAFGAKKSKDYVLDAEAAKRNHAIDTTGTNYTEKKEIFDKLRFLDRREDILIKLEDHSAKTGIPLYKMDECKQEVSLERQILLCEAVSLNMHLDMQAVHIRLPWNGTSEKFVTTSFKEYIGGLLEQYAVK